jgi:hypothetical protein
MVGPIEWASIHLPLEEVAMHTSLGVFMEVDVSISLIIDAPEGTLYQQLSPHPIRLFNIVIRIITILNKRIG